MSCTALSIRESVFSRTNKGKAVGTMSVIQECMQDNDNILQVENICKYYKAGSGRLFDKTVFKAVNQVSFSVKRGETFGLVGESGSGKSVTAMLIMRLLQTGSYCVHRGQISLLGDDVLNAREKQLRQWRGARVAMIFQEPMTALNPTRRIGLQMMDVIRHHQPISRREARAKAIALLE